MSQNRLAFLFFIIVSVAMGQTFTSSVNGTLLDPTGAAISRGNCRLTQVGTGVVLEASSGANGLFTFSSVPFGDYTLKVEAAGFKALEIKHIVVAAGEIRTLGNLTLQLGEVRESVTITAETAALQLASAERSGVVTGTQVNDIALKGRDFFALMQTIGGVVDTTASREATNNSANAGIFINGNRDNQKAFTVDGMIDHDTHSNGSMAFMPNMDSIAEIKILTSNYQAEYGRNSGGTITVITKSGTQSLHGSAYDFYRNETLNANNFFNNRSGTRRPPYRYRVSGYSLGGPIYIPGKFNRNKEKFFFFWSQEYTGIKTDYGTQFANTPTGLERNGDFSQSYAVNGALIPVKDPSTGRPFPGNLIPKNSISPLGQSILNFYPLPNFADPDPRNLYRWNLRSQYSGGTPRRDDILRIDANLTSSFRVYYRYGHDRDNYLTPWSAFPAGSINYLLTPVYQDRYGSGHLVHLTKTFSPTLVNETIAGYSIVNRLYDLQDQQLVARSRMGNPPQWYADTNLNVDYIPDVVFGGQPTGTIHAGLPAVVPNHYINTVYTATDTISKVSGQHSFKVGITVERTQATPPKGGSYRGAFDFSVDSNNPFDSGDSFANALLGNFRSYSEAQKRLPSMQRFWDFEWYAQDNWRATKRLTLDLGMRFYHTPNIKEIGKEGSTFDPSLYNPQKVSAIYVPARDANGARVAKDPITGNLAIPPLIGLFVPGTGDLANGLVIGGINGYPAGLYTRPWLAYGPRFGFAYDLFGNGRTALRGGWGLFHDTAQNNPFSNAVVQPPISYVPTLYYGNLGTYAQGGGAFGPSDVTVLYGEHKTPSTMNFSMGIQHQIWGSVIDASYVGGISKHLYITRNLNAIAMFARFDPKNADPTQPGRALPDNFMRPYPGYGNLTDYENVGSSKYNALQVSMNRRYARGLQFGLSYTYAKTLGVGSSDTESISPYFPSRQRNYGPLSFDRSQTLVLNYSYDLPKLGAKLDFKPVAWVLDNWVVSGVTSFISGAPFTPGFTTTNSIDISGSTEAARINVIGDAKLSGGDRTFFRNFNTAAFAVPAVGTFGNAGVGILRGPGINNWDMAASKRFLLFSESRWIQFRGELFNAWNHTQFSGLFTTAQFNPAGSQVDPNFGAFSTARTPRVIQLSLKVIF